MAKRRKKRNNRFTRMFHRSRAKRKHFFKGTRLERMCFKTMVGCAIIFAFGYVYLTSVEAKIEGDIHQTQTDIATLQNDIDGLTMEKQELTNFSRLSSAATKAGYTYKDFSTSRATVTTSN